MPPTVGTTQIRSKKMEF